VVLGGENAGEHLFM